MLGKTVKDRSLEYFEAVKDARCVSSKVLDEIALMNCTTGSVYRKTVQSKAMNRVSSCLKMAVSLVELRNGAIDRPRNDMQID